jgi:hypothetical protein
MADNRTTMKTLLIAPFLLALAIVSCSDSGTLPGTVTLTTKANANCAGIADTVDVRVNDVFFGTVVPGGAPFGKSVAPMRYTITARSRNGAKEWSETRDVLSSYTFECGCD